MQRERRPAASRQSLKTYCTVVEYDSDGDSETDRGNIEDECRSPARVRSGEIPQRE
jgi:hypothetical protein